MVEVETVGWELVLKQILQCAAGKSNLHVIFRFYHVVDNIVITRQVVVKTNIVVTMIQEIIPIHVGQPPKETTV